MNEAIHFKTSLFDVSKEKENPINPVYGLSLLEWLRAELANELVITEPDAEDWGWYSQLEYEGNIYLIGSCAFFEQGADPAAPRRLRAGPSGPSRCRRRQGSRRAG